MTDNPTERVESPSAAAPAAPASAQRRRSCWIKLAVQPLLLLGAGALVIAGLGLAQSKGWISAGTVDAPARQVSSHAENLRYVCPMMCIPPRSEPGRCPVCGMELVPVTSSAGDADKHSIQVDPVARRVANVRTAAVRSAPLVRRVRAVGSLSYDEGMLKTISAYVDGRLERLYADYTGAVVAKGEPLALLYSPELYSSQVELLVAKEAREQARTSSRYAATFGQHDLYQSARQRVLEYGMTPDQVADLERAGKADSRVRINAPISGTVIEKLAVEGQYVKTGQPIYRLADLSTVWLMLELFPEDAAAIRDGQRVEAEVQSLPGRTFIGRVAFLDPTVDAKTRTIGVRVVVPNDEGLLRVGDYAKANIAVELAGAREGPALWVPRDAVLMVGDRGVIYVETEPGRFQIRRVVVGAASGDEIAILEGVEEGEQVARSGNFLIDSQMQLAGNASLIDPVKAIPKPEAGVARRAQPRPERAQAAPPAASDREAREIAAAFSELSPGDRALAEAQKICPVTELPLGSMGAPVKVRVSGRDVFLCCEGCRESLLSEPAKHLAKLPPEVAR